MNGQDDQSQQTGQTGSSLQIGVDNIGGQSSGNGNGNGNDIDHVNGEEQVSGDDNGNGSGNGDNNGSSDHDGDDDQGAVIAPSGGTGDKGEIDDDQNVQSDQVIRQPESKQIESQGSELTINNNFDRREINKIIAQARVLYSKPTASRELNFDQLIQTLFEKYTEITNRAVSDQEKRDLEQLTINADNEQDRIKRIETELKELYEIAEHNRQRNFDSTVNNLWTTYSELVDEDTVSSLREECDNLTLTANEIDNLMEIEREKERVEEIERELTELYNRTTVSRPLDFGYKVDNLFMELSRIKGVPDTPQFRAPFENLTVKADNVLLQEGEEKRKEIELGL